MPEQWSTGVDLLLPRLRSGARRSSLEHALREAIRSGRMTSGARLPSTRVLAGELGLARGTVTAAYDQLVAEGYLVAMRGVGTLVADRVGPIGHIAPTAVSEPAAAERPPRFDLRPGSPDVSSFPVASWLRAARRSLTQADPTSFDYADPRGLSQLRIALADYLGRTRGVIADPEQIIVTNGTGHSLQLVARTIGQGPVAMEDPGLLFHREIVGRTGRGLVALPVDDAGADVRALGARACDLVVVTPAHQYPLGVPMRAERRRALIATMQERDGLIFEDDYDGEFRYDRQPIGALQGVAPDRVAYAGSASKTLAPGLRLGWLVLPARWSREVVEARMYDDMHTSTMTQLVMTELLTSHAYDRHVRMMRARYRKRRDLLYDVLARRTGRHARAMMPNDIPAGLQAVVMLREEEAVIAKAAAVGLALGPLSEAYHGRHPRSGLVIGFGRPSESSYRGAIDALARCLP